MDVVIKENLKVSNCVLISGLSNTAVDEVFEFLHEYGSISRTVEITDIQSAYCAQTIAEFEHGSAMTALEALPLPYPTLVMGILKYLSYSEYCKHVQRNLWQYNN